MKYRSALHAMNYMEGILHAYGAVIWDIKGLEHRFHIGDS